MKDIEYKLLTETSELDVVQINSLLTELTGKEIQLTLIEAKNTINTNYVIGAYFEKKIIGIGTLVNIQLFNSKQGRIEDVVVLKKFRRKKVGYNIMRQLIKRAKESGIEKLSLTSNPKRFEARKLYLDIGFQIIDTDVFLLKI